MLRPETLKIPLLLATLAMAGAGIALMSMARNSQVDKWTPVPGVPPAGEPTPTAAPTPKPAPPRQSAAPVEVPKDIQWRSDFKAALAEARTSGKPVMVDFYTDWCGFCKKLDAEVYTNFGVIAESAHFVSVKIDAEKHSDLASQYQVSGFPTIIWMNAEGTPVETLPGYTDASEFLDIMRRARASLSPASA